MNVFLLNAFWFSISVAISTDRTSGDGLAMLRDDMQTYIGRRSSGVRESMVEEGLTDFLFPEESFKKGNFVVVTDAPGRNDAFKFTGNPPADLYYQVVMDTADMRSMRSNYRQHLRESGCDFRAADRPEDLMVAPIKIWPIPGQKLRAKFNQAVTVEADWLTKVDKTGKQIRKEIGSQ